MGDATTCIGVNAGHGNVGGNVVAIGSGAGQRNSGNAVVAIGPGAGQNNTAGLCTFIGNNPNPAVGNVLDNQFIVYSTTATPLIQGDIGTNVVTVNRLVVKTIDPSNTAPGSLAQLYYCAIDGRFYHA